MVDNRVSRDQSYLLGDKKNWLGRKTDASVGLQYWHQAILVDDVYDISHSKADLNGGVAIIGYSCDEGVRRNQGRVGAKHGPQQIRNRLGKLSFHLEEELIFDFGDIVCQNEDLELCQTNFSWAISRLLNQNMFPIGLGGGHDIAFAHFNGIIESSKFQPDQKIGIINFDAHFDLRASIDKRNSGTPFYDILSNHNCQTEYLALGIQKSANPKELFDTVENLNVQFLDNYQCQLSNMLKVKDVLSDFICRNDLIYITIDLDGFSSSYAPGVSAPSPLGFTPYFVFEVLSFLFESRKVISCDIAEANPLYDIDQSTMNLAARLIDHISTCFHNSKMGILSKL